MYLILKCQVFTGLQTFQFLPSHMEATSITGLESISCGLPLVGTRVGGIPEIIKDGKNGYLIDKASPEQLASAIDLCFENKELLTGFSNSPRVV